MSVGRPRAAGYNGFYWSSVAASKNADGLSASSVYRLWLTNTIIGPSNGPYDRWYGFSLRELRLHHMIKLFWLGSGGAYQFHAQMDHAPNKYQ